MSGDGPRGALSILFAAGSRPDVAAIAHLSLSASNSPGGFAITHRPAPAEGWLELLGSGLVFDLFGLSPAGSAPMPVWVDWQGFGEHGVRGATAPPIEALTLVAGEHLRGGEHLLPVVRVMTGLAATLTGLPGCLGVGWHPARSVIPGPAFARAITAWLSGGAFPALCLTMLHPRKGGSMQSEGLDFLIGQELRLMPGVGQETAQSGKIAVRLIHALVESGKVTQPAETMVLEGKRLRLEPCDDGRCLNVWPID